jgi:hypothetical protein
LTTSWHWPYSWIFLSGHIKDVVIVSPLATNLPKLAGRIRDAVAAVTLDLLNNVWTETEYRCDCQAVTALSLNMWKMLVAKTWSYNTLKWS